MSEPSSVGVSERGDGGWQGVCIAVSHTYQNGRSRSRGHPRRAKSALVGCRGHGRCICLGKGRAEVLTLVCLDSVGGYPKQPPDSETRQFPARAHAPDPALGALPALSKRFRRVGRSRLVPRPEPPRPRFALYGACTRFQRHIRGSSRVTAGRRRSRRRSIAGQPPGRDSGKLCCISAYRASAAHSCSDHGRRKLRCLSDGDPHSREWETFHRSAAANFEFAAIAHGWQLPRWHARIRRTRYQSPREGRSRWAGGGSPQPDLRAAALWYTG